MNTQKIKVFFAALCMSAIVLPSIGQVGYGNKNVISKRDADGDGVKDKKDKCPATPAGVLVDENGCPVDTDKDGVADYLDKCYDVPGTVEMNGCQDKDKDGVSDAEDACPDVPGLPRFRGCPDSDGDGIEDSKDKCPNSKGLDMFQGCPDTDGDGVQDALDKCPSSPKGIKVDATGCPADQDRDGIADSEDKCPDTKAGVKVDDRGCPADTDGDGVVDTDDKCPAVAGDPANNGCPVEKKVAPAPKRLNFAVRRINFETASGLVKTTDFPMLDEVAAILNEYPDYFLRIGGHTDAIEKGSATPALSQNRAEAVKSYLLGKNIPESRITVMAYGKTRPMGSNKTVAGKAQNRRVELELYLK